MLATATSVWPSPKTQITLEFFCRILARDAEGTQLQHVSLREEVLSIFEQDPLIELILTGVENGVEILKNSINSNIDIVRFRGSTRISKLLYKRIEIKYSWDFLPDYCI